jgi:hypothetical protein
MKPFVWSPFYTALSFCLTFFAAGVLSGNNAKSFWPALAWALGVSGLVEIIVWRPFEGQLRYKDLFKSPGLIPIWAGLAYFGIAVGLPEKYQQTVWGIGFWIAAALFAFVFGRFIWTSFTKK